MPASAISSAVSSTSSVTRSPGCMPAASTRTVPKTDPHCGRVPASTGKRRTRTEGLDVVTPATRTLVSSPSPTLRSAKVMTPCSQLSRNSSPSPPWVDSEELSTRRLPPLAVEPSQALQSTSERAVSTPPRQLAATASAFHTPRVPLPLVALTRREHDLAEEDAGAERRLGEGHRLAERLAGGGHGHGLRAGAGVDRDELDLHRVEAAVGRLVEGERLLRQLEQLPDAAAVGGGAQPLGVGGVGELEHVHRHVGEGAVVDLAPPRGGVGAPEVVVDVDAVVGAGEDLLVLARVGVDRNGVEGLVGERAGDVGPGDAAVERAEDVAGDGGRGRGGPAAVDDHHAVGARGVGVHPGERAAGGRRGHRQRRLGEVAPGEPAVVAAPDAAGRGDGVEDLRARAPRAPLTRFAFGVCTMFT